MFVIQLSYFPVSKFLFTETFTSMKHKFTLLTFSALVAVLLCSYRPGPAHDAGANTTGSDGRTAACGGSGCHSSSLSTNLATTLEFDSAGVPVPSYVPGGTYTVKITATNSTGLTLPKFGFQVVSITAGSAGGNANVQAGTWSSSLPSSVRNTTTAQSGLPIPVIEQSGYLSPASGTGSAGTVYTETITWTAPAAGTGDVMFYGTIQAVNNNGNESGDKSQQAAPLTITEAVVAPNGINDPTLAGAIRIYPTVTSGTVTIQSTVAGLSYEVYGTDGALHTHGTMISDRTTLDLSGLAGGIYLIRMQSQGKAAIYKVVKN